MISRLRLHFGGPSRETPPAALPVGTPVRIGILESERLWHPSRLEWQDTSTDTIAVGWPMERLRLLPIKIGDRVLLSAAREDALYATEVKVEQAISAGLAHLVVRRTGAWKRLQRRADVRFPLRATPVLAERIVNEERQCLRSVLRDLSAGGLLLRSAAELAPGDRLELAFSLPSTTDEIAARALVVRMTGAVPSSLAVSEAGCRFEELDAHARDRIVQWIFEQQRLQAARTRSSSGTEVRP